MNTQPSVPAIDLCYVKTYHIGMWQGLSSVIIWPIVWGKKYRAKRCKKLPTMAGDSEMVIMVVVDGPVQDRPQAMRNHKDE